MYYMWTIPSVVTGKMNLVAKYSHSFQDHCEFLLNQRAKHNKKFNVYIKMICMLHTSHFTYRITPSQSTWTSSGRMTGWHSLTIPATVWPWLGTLRRRSGFLIRSLLMTNIPFFMTSQRKIKWLDCVEMVTSHMEWGKYVYFLT